ncbi:MAG: Integral membrane protein TerC family protein [Acidobacteria bacterium OLB17]|nr:MAG: Integral membrane protein TerC family protein [Acidobacteria bacterium OLB17]MCZ2389636.1 TerC family protein [Acidobacteriota bacterium]
MEWIFDPQIWIAFFTLSLLELVLGIDNIIFISILSGRLPEKDQPRARFVGLALALVMRVGLLFSLSWVMGLTTPLFTVFGNALSGRDLILVLGGLFLLFKSTHEIHSALEGEEGGSSRTVYAGFTAVIVQIMLLDIVFSLDSVITAIGMVNNVWVMIAAVVVSIIAMMLFAGSIGAFVQRHPTLKMLALSFLLMIGFSLIVEGLEYHIPKGYIYFAMAFSVMVEFLNIRLRKKVDKVHLHSPFSDADEAKALAE